MGISHSIDQTQVSDVLCQFEATNAAIRGIESKVEKVKEHQTSAQTHRKAYHHQADRATRILEHFTQSLHKHGDEVLSILTENLDTFAGLVENLELAIHDMGLQDLPSAVLHDFGPLLLPAVVVVMIVTVSNCIFGFILAGDEKLSEALTTITLVPEGVNILLAFAVFHVVLVAASVLYLILEACRLMIPRRINAAKAAARSRQQDEADAEEDGEDEGASTACSCCRTLWSPPSSGTSTVGPGSGVTSTSTAVMSVYPPDEGDPFRDEQVALELPPPQQYKLLAPPRPEGAEPETAHRGSRSSVNGFIRVSGRSSVSHRSSNGSMASSAPSSVDRPPDRNSVKRGSGEPRRPVSSALRRLQKASEGMLTPRISFETTPRVSFENWAARSDREGRASSRSIPSSQGAASAWAKRERAASEGIVESPSVGSPATPASPASPPTSPPSPHRTPASPRNSRDAGAGTPSPAITPMSGRSGASLQSRRSL